MPVASAADVIPHGIASGKFHGEITAVYAARHVAQLVALAGNLKQRSARAASATAARA